MDENRIVGDSENERIVNLNGNYQSIAISGVDTYTYTSLVIVTPPAQTDYLVGDTFNSDELICEAKLVGVHTGEEKGIDLYPDDLMIMPVSPLTLSDTQVTISYTIDNITHEVTCPITVTEPVYYAITGNVTNGTYAAPASVREGESATFTVTADEGYDLPASLEQFTITGADGSYNSSTGVLLLSNFTGDVTVTVTCPEKPDFANPWTNEEMQYFVTTWSNQTGTAGTYNLANAPFGFVNTTNPRANAPEYAGKLIYSATIPMRCRTSDMYSDNMSFTWGIIKRNSFYGATPANRVALSEYTHTETGLTLAAWNTVELKTFIINRYIEEDEMLWIGVIGDTITPIINQGPSSTSVHPGRDFSSHKDSYTVWFGPNSPSTGNYVQPIQFSILEPEDKTLTSIEIATPPTTTAYAVGTSFNPAGMVVNAKYTGNDTGTVYTVEDVEFTYSPTGPLTAQDTEVTISFTDDGVTKTTTQAIVVSQSFSISGSITNGTLTGDIEIVEFGNAWVTITPNSGYAAPGAVSEITVTNATVVDYTSGMLTIANPTGNVVITATCTLIPALTDVWTLEELGEFYDEFNGSTHTGGTYNPNNAPFAIGSFNTFPSSGKTSCDGNILKGLNVHSITMPFRCRQESNYSADGMKFTWGVLKGSDFSKNAANRRTAMTNVHEVTLTLSEWNHVENKEIIIDYTLGDNEYFAFGVGTDTISPLINQNGTSGTTPFKRYDNHPGYVVMYGASNLASGPYVQPMIVTLN